MARRLRVVAQRTFDLCHLDRLLGAEREHRATFLRRQLAIEAQRDVWGEREPRGRVREAASHDAFVQLPQRSIRAQRQDDDLCLHEPHGRANLEGEWRRGRGDRSDGSSEIGHTGRWRDGTGARRADQRDVRRHLARQLRVEPGLHIANEARERLLERRDDVDARPRPPSSGWIVRRGFSRLRRHFPLSAIAPGNISIRTAMPPLAPREMEPDNKRSSILLPGCEWWYRTIFRPAKLPISAPVMTSLAQCLLLYIRESPMSDAPPYINGPTYHVELGHQRPVSVTTADAAANPATVCPDGKERYASFLPNPRRNL